MARTATNLVIYKGKTYNQVVRWESTPIVYKAISAITQTAPVSITAVGHGVPDGWRVAIVSVKGMTQINAENNPPESSDYHQATVTGADTLTLNAVNAASFKAYTTGGYVQYNTPVDMAGFTARMAIKDKVGGTELFRLDTANSRIAINNSTKTVTLSISATDTAALTFSSGVYDLEMVSASGVVTALLNGKVSVIDEVTTT